MNFSCRRIRRHIVSTGSLAMMLVAGLALSPSAGADSRVVAPNGNLLALDTAGVVRTISPAGVTSTFPIPSGTRAEAIANRPDGKVAMVARASSTITSLPSLYRFSPTGTFDVDPLGLGSIMARPAKFFGARDVTIGSDGTTWVSQGWAPCNDPEPGNIARIAPDGTLSIIEGPMDFDGRMIYPDNQIEADGGGRLWIDGAAPRNVECEGNSASYGGVLFVGYISPDGVTHETDCRWGEPKIAVTTDGAAWCVGRGLIYRMDVNGEIRSYDLPEGWTDPMFTKAGPDGTYWFASQTNVDEETGVYVPPWSVASISPAGELRTYPSLGEDLVDPNSVVSSPGSEWLYDWYFTKNGKIWVLSDSLSGQNPYQFMLDLPAGVSQGNLDSRPATFPENPVVVDPPVDIPPPVIPTPVALQLSMKTPKSFSARQVRKTRTIPVRLTSNLPSKLTVRAWVTNRQARKLGLRSKKSKMIAKMMIAGQTVTGSGSTTLNLQLTKGEARKLTIRPTAIQLDARASTADAFSVDQRVVTIT